ncbi:MAG: hypothetical protein ACRAS9_00115 [Mycoplasma sp.]
MTKNHNINSPKPLKVTNTELVEVNPVSVIAEQEKNMALINVRPEKPDFQVIGVENKIVETNIKNI